MAVRGGDLSHNLAHARELIAEASSNDAQLALLPECLDLGWTHPSSQHFAGPIPEGQAYSTLAQAAVENNIFVCAGLTEIADGCVFNTAVLIDNKGNLLTTHRKLNELSIGHAYYAQGRTLGVVDTPLGSVGLMTCADAFATDHVLSRSLGYMGADIILSPCAWAVPPHYNNETDPYGDLWRQSYMPTARDFCCYILGVSNVGPITGGPWQGWQCIGCSLAIGPDGEELLQGPYGVSAECILYLDITPQPRPARGDDWQALWAQNRNAKAS